jgi:hypothetical protein
MSRTLRSSNEADFICELTSCFTHDATFNSHAAAASAAAAAAPAAVVLRVVK